MSLQRIKDIVARTNQHLESVEWDIVVGGGPQHKLYKLVKHVRERDKEAEYYWWPTIIIDYCSMQTFQKKYGTPFTKCQLA